MVDKLRQLAAWERDWGSLSRWLASIVFFLVVYSLLHFADIHYVKRSEFLEMDAKLDSLVSTVAQDATRLQDVQERLHRIENSQDIDRMNESRLADPSNVARK
jgi:hypothetical protein